MSPASTLHIDWRNDISWALWRLGPTEARTAYAMHPYDPHAWQDWVTVALVWLALLVVAVATYRLSIRARRRISDWVEQNKKNPAP